MKAELISIRPGLLWSNPHLQTIKSTLFPTKSNITQVWDDFLFRTSSEDRIFCQYLPGNKKNSPLVVLLHGMEGSSDSDYLIRSIKAIKKFGFSILKMNLKNCGRGYGYAKNPYNAGDYSDLHQILKWAETSITKKILCMGFSLSANILIRYFGMMNGGPALGFLSVSPPIDLWESARTIDLPKNMIYQKQFLITLKSKVRNRLYTMTDEQYKMGLKSNSFIEFDNAITAPLSGYRNVYDYYQQCSGISFVSKINKPGWILASMDDPLIPPRAWNGYNPSSSIKTIFTKDGGHVGFHTPKDEWFQRVIVDFLKQF